MDDDRRRSRGGIYAAIAAVAITIGLGIAGAAGARGTGTEYVLTAPPIDGAWSPSSNITVQTNDTVRWTFPSGYHNVQSSGTNWAPPIPDDGPTSGHPDVLYTFTAEGTYAFHCEAHPGTMDGTITVQDEPVSTPTAIPSATATPQPSGDPTTPSPSGGSDTVKPTVRSLRPTALRRAVRIRFTLSEPATVTVRVKRARRTVKSARVQASAGTRTVTLRSKRLRQGRYTVEIEARDASGNRSLRATKRVTLRR